MNRSRQNPRRTIIAAALLATLGLSSCTGAAGTTSTANSGNAGNVHTVASGDTLNEKLPASVADTRLVDQNGKSLTLGSLRGQVVVLAPFLTLCQETCPMTSSNMHQAAAHVHNTAGSSKVHFVEVTVDPARDTAARLHAYQKLYGALPNWTLATGHPDAIKAMWRTLGVSTEKVPTPGKTRDWMTGSVLQHPYDVHHQDVVFAIDAQGHIRWLTVGSPNARGSTLPTTIRRFLDEEGRRNFRAPGAGSWTAGNIEQAVRYVERVGTP